MSSAQNPTLGGSTRAGRIIGPTLHKIIKNVAWRKHTDLVDACKSALDELESITESPDPESTTSSVYSLTSEDAGAVIAPLILAMESGIPKAIEPSLECVQKLFSQGILQGEIQKGTESVAARLMECVCKCDVVRDDEIEIVLMRVVAAAVGSTVVMMRGECLVYAVKSVYNVYLSSQNAANQVCAKAVLMQIMLIVFGRTEVDKMDVKVKVVEIADILDLSDKRLNDSSVVQFAHNFINEIIWASSVDNSEWKGREVSVWYAIGMCEGDEGGSKVRKDGLFLFRILCDFSMNFSTQENPEDHLLMRAKVLSLELLKTAIENSGQIWRSKEFLGAIKQYLCPSILKNSALSTTSIFQLLCSIFISMLLRFRSGLKEEIGMFFPSIVLRVLGNVLQPNFLQKMTVFNLLEKIFQDPQIIIDIFANYDCDVDAPNIFERTVNALLKTSLGVPPGSATTLSHAQDMMFRLKSVKCLTSIVKSMRTWVDQQLQIGEFCQKTSEIDISTHVLYGEDVLGNDFDLQSDVNSGLSDALTPEQCRSYKIEFQKGIALFNKMPSKGIEFLISTKKIDSSPEEVASFLRNTSGLNETMIGDYLGDNHEFHLKVMHAYMDSLNFKGMDFVEAISFFLSCFRLPEEAQKIDRIMEKFAECYCKCNPMSFATADTAYVLAYSVIVLNIDAHNNMVKDKMSKVDFINSNRGIDDGKDLPEDYLGSLYDHIIENEIKMKSDCSVSHNKHVSGINKLLGLDTILNLVVWKPAKEKPLGAKDLLIRHIQDQFKAKTGKSEPVFYSVTDATILIFMMESCWAPMMAAFSVTFDQSDDKAVTSQCLQGFRYAVHVTSMMSMQTQRDAFVTSVAKFTYLHNAADMKQKNVDAVKAIISIAIEDGNYLGEAWEPVLTCLSRFEHLQPIGEGTPTDASKNSAHAPYDSTTVGINDSGLVPLEQTNNFISNLNLSDHIGNFELDYIFSHSQRLNSEAVVVFVKSLCKVSMEELQFPTDLRVFSLTKIVEIAYYNMNRIKLVWFHIWSVLSDFFVRVGLSGNLSVMIFVMDSLRQLTMEFLEHGELANYNFNNEFFKPYVIVMQKSGSSEIRELTVRCISQIVLSRVNHVKSGWKNIFKVFTTAASDDHKNIVQLAFETMDKIVRDYFLYITEIETMTFTDCVRCLSTFASSNFSIETRLNAIALLRVCAAKLVEGGLVCFDKNSEHNFVNEDALISDTLTYNNDHVNYWITLLAGLSKLTSDPRSDTRNRAVEVFFNILKGHGQLFPHSFWMNVFNSFIFPVFSVFPSQINDNLEDSQRSDYAQHDKDLEIQTMLVRCLVDLSVNFFDAIRYVLPNIVSILTSSIRSPDNSSTGTTVAALLHFTSNLNSKLTEEEWIVILQSLKAATLSTFCEFFKIVQTMESVEIPDAQADSGEEFDTEIEGDDWDTEENNMVVASYSMIRTKGHISVQLLLAEAVASLYETHSNSLTSAHIKILLEILSSIVSHSSEMNNESAMRLKFETACTHMDISEPPFVHLENESYQNYLRLLQTIRIDKPWMSEDFGVEHEIVRVCEKILNIYLDCGGYRPPQEQCPNSQQTVQWVLRLSLAKKEELAARTSLAVHAMRVLNDFERDTFRRYVLCLFPLLVKLIRCEHSSGELQVVLSEVFRSFIGPIVLKSLK